ncbi:SigE family RNA polymerase sigma factor [Mangrovihabitans endophyticus]|uniref:RNA polymerase sigma factor n=1 Tax=Mangrovihabitans endophyticus TaxID=1751298 RepID=A0A8J3C5M4_9ACTN|nr:RNA polymerase sigma factor [Mangrovihabitans endophyticus]
MADRESAFQVFFDEHHADLSRLAYLITGDANAADDIAADSLLEIWRHWERVTAADNPLAYARGVAANLSRNWIRRQRRERLGLLNMKLLLEDYRNPDVSLVMDVRAALRRLPLRRRECVVLRYAFDVPEREVAEILGISVGTVKSQTARGAAQLAALLVPAVPALLGCAGEG